jgi:prephenate dehydratase
VPFENSSNGSVIFTLDLFADPARRYPDILVDGEIYLAVHHCLVGFAPRIDSKDAQQPSKFDLPWRRSQQQQQQQHVTPTPSGACTPTQRTPSPAKPHVKPHHDLSHITKLYSHPQAWGQCKLFLNTYLKAIERQDASSTSRAAEQVARAADVTHAAISSKIAANLNQLDVLAENIEDNEGNSTRFLILRRRAPDHHLPASPTNSSSDSASDPEPHAACKTLVAFTVAHGSPGALADSLAVFKTHALNLTNFQSRPSGQAPWHYIFFVECQGRKRRHGAGGHVNDALEQLRLVTDDCRWLGSWEDQLGAMV